jgi:2-polyprenyl-6-methoxyphenol hydroxylase-like FAD-dependent oxidoreductase
LKRLLRLHPSAIVLILFSVPRYGRAVHSFRHQLAFSIDGGVLYPLDDEGWLAGLVGWVGDHPPVDEAGFLSFAQSLPQPDLYEATCGAQALTPVRKHVFPANRWRRFERVAGWPDRFLVVGDAVCRFNPVYGQGMSVSALDAVTIARALRSERDPGAAGEAQRLQRALARHRAAAWLLAIVADLRFPEARGRRPAWLWPLDFYTRGVLSISGDDPSTHLRFVRVAGLLDSPALMIHPATVAKVFQRALLSL